MKSIRLNKEIREAILKNISTAYQKANPKPELTKQDAAKEVYEKCVRSIYAKAAKKALEVLERNPALKECIQYRSSLSYCTASGVWGYIHNVDEKGTELEDQFINYYGKRTVDFRNTELVAKSKPMQTALAKVRKLDKEAREERAARTTYNRELEAYMEQCRQVVYGVNTTAQLLEVWAEVKEFIPTGYVDPSKIQLPAVNVQSLNAKLKK